MVPVAGGMSERETQNALILDLLTKYGRVSAHDLTFRFGITRAAARIWELRHKGHNIVTDPSKRLDDGTRTMAEYRLVGAEPTQAALPW